MLTQITLRTRFRSCDHMSGLATVAATLQVPFLFKYAIDGLTMDPSGATAVAVPLAQLVPATLLLGYGAARAGSALCNEVRNAIFAKVSDAHMSCK